MKDTKKFKKLLSSGNYNVALEWISLMGEEKDPPSKKRHFLALYFEEVLKADRVKYAFEAAKLMKPGSIDRTMSFSRTLEKAVDLGCYNLINEIKNYHRPISPGEWMRVIDFHLNQKNFVLAKTIAEEQLREIAKKMFLNKIKHYALFDPDTELDFFSDAKLNNFELRVRLILALNKLREKEVEQIISLFSQSLLPFVEDLLTREFEEAISDNLWEKAVLISKKINHSHGDAILVAFFCDLLDQKRLGNCLEVITAVKSEEKRRRLTEEVFSECLKIGNWRIAQRALELMGRQMSDSEKRGIIETLTEGDKFDEAREFICEIKKGGEV